MSAGQITQGRRIHMNGSGLHLDSGDYGHDGDGRWWIRPPGCDAGIIGPETGHTVTEHDDGTITVSPSILLPGQWHGYLERGVWREV